MRNLETGSVLAVRAIGGLHVVTLAWDFSPDQEQKKDTLLGFAIERSEIKNGVIVERYFLKGIKRFKDKDKGLPPGTPVPTSEHPIQSFQWGDYTAKPATSYVYRVVPTYGSPKLLTLDDSSATEVSIATEPEMGPGKKGETRHDIYFNRGVAGSQAYAREFPGQKPDEGDPLSPQMAWLSRGLYEALIGFIGRAEGERYKLRCMFYEFRYKPVGDALKAAVKSGADVQIRYEAQAYKDDNEAMIKAAGIKSLCRPQKTRAGIRHNKFMVLIKDDQPIAVWTGSTNISAGGIFGHSNVGHIIWDETVAERFLEYWTELAAPDVATSELKKLNLEQEPTPERQSEAPRDRILTLFCPRDDKSTVATLSWYGDLVMAAQRILCMTFAFNFDKIFETAFESKGTALRYGVFDKSQPKDVEDQVTRDGMAVIASGSYLKKGDLELFIGEQLTGFNKNRYIHDKFILSDPLGDDPVVVTGTANFSRPSQVANDENMQVIRGNTRVADIYFGEFMRVFDHLYSRYIVAKLKSEGKADPNAGYLKEKTSEWLPKNFSKGPKSLRRQYFMGER